MGRKESNKQTNLASEQKTGSICSCADPEGGGQGVLTTPENHKNIEVSSITGLDLLKIAKLHSQHSMWAIIGLPAKRHFNGVSLVGRLLPAYGGFWSLTPLEKKRKKKEKTYQSWTPLTKLSGSGHNVSYLVFGRIHTKFGIKIFEIDFVIENHLYLIPT